MTEVSQLPLYRVLVTGWRNWPRISANVIHEQLQIVYQWLLSDQSRFSGMIVMEGACPYDGVDAYANEWAEARKRQEEPVIPERVRAKWGVAGRAAGPLRNQEMVDREPDFFLAFPQFLSPYDSAGNRSRWSGTHDCMSRALAARVPGYVVPWVGEPKRIVSGFYEQLDENDDALRLL